MGFCSVFEHQKKKYLFRTMRTRCEPVIEGSPKGAAITERDYAPVLLLACKGDYESRQSSIIAEKVEFPLASTVPLSAYHLSLELPSPLSLSFQDIQ